MKKITFLIYVLLLFSGFSCFAQPANNDCSGALTLSVDAFSCDNSIIQVTIDNTATPSGVPDPGCASYSGADDVWYKFVMPANGKAVRIETREGTIDDNGMAIYTGNCGSLTLYGCNDDGNGINQLMATFEVAQPAGQTIYIRLWTFNGEQTGNFDICAVEIPSPSEAINDDCIDASLLTLNTTCTNPLIGSNNATNSEIADSTIPSPGACANSYLGRDIWYKFTVPSTGRFSIETSNNDSSITDTAMALYSGNCGIDGLSFITCDDDGGSGAFSKIEESFTIGTELFVRVWAFENLNLGTFTICALELPSLSVDDFNKDNFSVFPNPAKDIVNLKFSQNINDKIDVNIYNIQGKLVLNTTKALINNKSQLDISSIKSGMYFLKIYIGDTEVTKKLIVR